MHSIWSVIIRDIVKKLLLKTVLCVLNVALFRKSYLCTVYRTVTSWQNPTSGELLVIKSQDEMRTVTRNLCDKSTYEVLKVVTLTRWPSYVMSLTCHHRQVWYFKSVFLQRLEKNNFDLTPNHSSEDSLDTRLA